MTTTISAARAVDWLTGARPWQAFLVVFVPVLAVYAATMADSEIWTNVDSVAAGLPAWRFALFGDLDLSAFDGIKFVREIDGRLLSNRTPGISFISVPAYWLFGSKAYAGVIPSQIPATATAAVLSAGAVGTLHLVFRRVAAPVVALVAALAFGFATSTWSISSTTLWPHGPGQFFLALALLAIASHRYLAAGLAYGAAVLIRPVTGVLAAVPALYLSWKQRSWRPALLVAATSAIGIGLLVLYNGLVLDEWSLAPDAYGSGFITRARSQGVVAYGLDLFLTFFSTRYSLFLFSPFLLFTIPGLRAAWRSADGWVRAGGLAAVVYLLITLRLNRHGGGQPFNYRYPLEPLVLAAPLLLLSVQAWYRRVGDDWHRLFWYSVGFSVLAQGLAIYASRPNWDILNEMYDLGLLPSVP